jgi:hypothetical protein
LKEKTFMSENQNEEEADVLEVQNPDGSTEEYDVVKEESDDLEDVSTPTQPYDQDAVPASPTETTNPNVPPSDIQNAQQEAEKAAEEAQKSAEGDSTEEE